MNYYPTNINNKFELFSEQWQPKVIAEFEPIGCERAGEEEENGRGRTGTGKACVWHSLSRFGPGPAGNLSVHL